MTDQIVHIVKNKETITSIAQRYNIPSEKILINFHNQYCALEDLIAPNIRLKKGSTIIIPTEENLKNILDKTKSNQQQNKERQITRFAHEPIVFPFIHTQHQYLLNTRTHADENGKSIKREYSHVISLHYIRKDKENYLIEYQKRINTVNQKKAFSKIQELAISCDRQVYPMQWLVSPNLEILGIKNILEIRRNWKLSIPKLKDSFSGDFVSPYLQAHDQSIMSKTDLLKSVLQDYLIALYFSPYHKKFQDYKCSFKTLYGTKNIGFVIDQEIQDKEKAAQFIKVIQTGKTLENQEHTIKLANGNSIKPTGKMKAEFKLDKKYNYIDSLNAEFQIRTSPYKFDIISFELQKF